ncbi:MAG: ATP-grasp domain-containing protein [Deltaproteobacteria bacterium]|nr:MAG: ATP-grasp domain-containing protein [Deltaproteobacteria bacterium]
MTLYFLLALRNAVSPNPVLVETFSLLRKRGFNIEIGMGQELLLPLDNLAVTRDLYILKSHTALWLSLAEIIHARGGRLLNPFPACLAAQNKIVAVERMRAGGVPTPRSWVTGNPSLLRSIVEEHPVIIKPYNGGRGLGIRIVQRSRELAKSRPPRDPVVVQEYIRHDDEVKVYVIGEEVFGIRMRSGDVRRWSCPISDEVREIALRCGRLFGLGLYGLDVIESAEGPLIFDMNYFPSDRDVPNAAALPADFIEDYALAPATTRLRRKMGGTDTVIRASAQ